ncbi:hypothetical protein NEIELOOT_01806, partial [Neisseria elongata subsp. glycolytica ATCC 29315]
FPVTIRGVPKLLGRCFISIICIDCQRSTTTSLTFKPHFTKRLASKGIFQILIVNQSIVRNSLSCSVGQGNVCVGGSNQNSITPIKTITYIERVDARKQVFNVINNLTQPTV